MQALFQGVERARADVSEHHSQRTDDESRVADPMTPRVRFGRMIAVPMPRSCLPRVL